MTQFHGKNLNFQIYDSIPTIRDMSAHITSVDFPRSVDSADISTAGLGDHSFMAGMRNATITLNVVWDDTATTGPDVVFAGLLGTSPNTPTTSGGFIFGPSGSTSGRVKYSGAACVTAFNVTSGVGDAVRATVTMQCHGTITRGTY